MTLAVGFTNSLKAAHEKGYSNVVTSPYIECYNCEGSGVVIIVNRVSQTEKPGPDSHKRTILIKCPLCKGFGYKDQGQGQLFTVSTLKRVGNPKGYRKHNDH